MARSGSFGSSSLARPSVNPLHSGNIGGGSYSIGGSSASAAQSEKDQEVAQDYQHDRITGEQYIAYVTARRDSYTKGDPSDPYAWDQWNRVLEDLTDQVSKNSDTSAKNALSLKAYEADVAYQNGEMSDGAYLANLNAQVGQATTPQERESALNKLHDTQYSIDSARATAQGLDAVIAFEQATLAGMDPGNYRAASIRTSIASHLAERRSRDYSNLVSRYNDDELSTEALQAWVANTLAGLDPSAPDYANWKDTANTLRARIEDEKWSQIQADHSDHKVTDAAYLAYIQGRRDAVSPTSPAWDTWNRNLATAVANVEADKRNTAYKADADKWKAGHESDATHIAFLRSLIDGLPPDDSNRPGLVAEYNDVKFRMAEDVLSYKVKTATTKAGQRAALQDLYTFDAAYLRTLTPGSEAYRAADLVVRGLKDQLDTPVKSSGGGGGGGTGTDFGAFGSPPPATTDPKVTSDAAMRALDVTMSGYATAKTDPRGAAEAVLQGNVNRLRRALGMPDEATGLAAGGVGTKFYLYQDPANPYAMTGAIDEATGKPVLDANGKRVMVQGARYYAATQTSLADLLVVKSRYYATRNYVLNATGDHSGAANARNTSDTAGDQATKLSMQVGGTAHLALALDTVQKVGPKDAPSSRLQLADEAARRADPSDSIAQTLIGISVINRALESDSGYADQTVVSALEDAKKKLMGGSLLYDGIIDAGRTTVSYIGANGQQTTGVLSLVMGDKVQGQLLEDSMAAGTYSFPNVALSAGSFHTLNPTQGTYRTPDGQPNWTYVHLPTDDAVAALNAGGVANPTPEQITAEVIRENGLIPVTTVRNGVAVQSTVKPEPIRQPVAGNAPDQQVPGPLIAIHAHTVAGAPVNVTVDGNSLLGNSLQMTRFADEHGHMLTAYSIDGWNTYATSGPGMQPTIAWVGNLTRVTDDKGDYLFIDDNDVTVFVQKKAGTVTQYDHRTGQAKPTTVDSPLLPADPNYFANVDNLTASVAWAGAGNADVEAVWDPVAKRYVRGWTTQVWTSDTGAKATTEIGSRGPNGSLTMVPSILDFTAAMAEPINPYLPGGGTGLDNRQAWVPVPGMAAPGIEFHSGPLSVGATGRGGYVNERQMHGSPEFGPPAPASASPGYVPLGLTSMFPFLVERSNAALRADQNARIAAGSVKPAVVSLPTYRQVGVLPIPTTKTTVTIKAPTLKTVGVLPMPVTNGPKQVVTIKKPKLTTVGVLPMPVSSGPAPKKTIVAPKLKTVGVLPMPTSSGPEEVVASGAITVNGKTIKLGR